MHWADTAPLGGCPFQTGLAHEQVGLQHPVEKVLCLAKQFMRMAGHSSCKAISYLFGLGWFWVPSPAPCPHI